MERLIEKLEKSPRLLMEIELAPVQGDRFQPTGFADLGAAVYERPDGQRMILLETSQSVANRLEHTCLENNGPEIKKELSGLPYVRVRLAGASQSVTSSLIEAHRLNSPFIISDAGFKDTFVKLAEYGKNKPLDWNKISRAIFYFDPNSLLHGLFMANLEDGRIKSPRALTGFIEAEDIREAASGGVKNNPLDPSGTMRAEGFESNVYGNVPYHRMEFTAGRIMAYFNMDLALLRGYGLPREATDLLTLLALYKIRAFVDSGLRLRTACDLRTKGDFKVTQPTDFALPDNAGIMKALRQSIEECTKAGLFAPQVVTEITTKVKITKEKKAKEGPEENSE